MHIEELVGSPSVDGTSDLGTSICEIDISDTRVLVSTLQLMCRGCKVGRNHYGDIGTGRTADQSRALEGENLLIDWYDHFQ